MLVEVVSIVVGLLLAVFRREFTAFVTNFQHKNFHAQFSTKEIKIAERSYLFTALVLLAISIYRIVSMISD